MKQAVVEHLNQTSVPCKRDIDYNELTIEVIMDLADIQPKWLEANAPDYSRNKRRFRSMYDLVRHAVNSRRFVRRGIQTNSRQTQFITEEPSTQTGISQIETSTFEQTDSDICNSNMKEALGTRPNAVGHANL